MTHSVRVMKQRFNLPIKPDTLVNVVVLAEHGEKWVFMFHDDRLPEVLECVDRWIANPDLAFTQANGDDAFRMISELYE